MVGSVAESSWPSVSMAGAALAVELVKGGYGAAAVADLAPRPGRQHEPVAAAR